PVIVMILDLFWELFRQARERSALAEVADPMETYGRHVEILKAVESRDIQALRAAIASHYIGLEKRLYAAGDLSATRLLLLAAARHPLGGDTLDGRDATVGGRPAEEETDA